MHRIHEVDVPRFSNASVLGPSWAKRPIIKLGQFDITGRLGHGGMSVVFEGHHRRQRRRVAVKVVTAHKARQERYRLAFRDEVQNVARLNHPHVVEVYDFGQIPEAFEQASDGKLIAGSPYLVMEHIDGGTLSDYAPELEWFGVQRFLTSILDALSHAHARRVIHRDLKPDNVLIDVDARGQWQPKLTDFGIARALDKETFEGKGDVDEWITGTPKYMAPESIRGLWRQQGPWTDLYGLGCIAWWLCAGRPPFFDGGTTRILQDHVYTPPPRLDPVIEVPEGFEHWLCRLLAKDPADRFQCAADAAFALLRLGQRRPGHQMPRRRGDEQPGRPPFLPTWKLEHRRRDTKMQLDGAGLGLFGLRTVPMVARDRARTLVWDMLRQAHLEGSARLLAVTGSYGCGKSRLCEWMCQRAHELGTAEYFKATHSPNKGPLDGLGPMLARFFRCAGQAPEDIVRTMRDKLHRYDLVGQPADYLARALATIVWETSAGDADEAFVGVDFSSPDERFAAVATLLRLVARERTVMLWLDDVHWSLQALDFAAYLLREADAREKKAKGLPLLVMMTARSELVGLEAVGVAAESRETGDLDPSELDPSELDPADLDPADLESEDFETIERVAPRARADSVDTSGQVGRKFARLLEHRNAHSLELGPLSKSDHLELVKTMLGLDDKLTREVAQRTQGNPLFAIQLVGDWVDRGLLEVGDDGFVLRESARAQVPDDIYEMWRQRLKSLQEHFEPGARAEVRVALELAAALGLDVSTQEWLNVCVLTGVSPPENLVHSLSMLRLALPAPGGWSFAHGMLAESLQRSAQEGGRWQAYHRTCAHMLAETYHKGTRGIAERRAMHLLVAGEDEAAIELIHEAASEAYQAGEYELALGLLDEQEQAITRLGLLPTDKRRAQNKLLRAKVTIECGSLERASELAAHLEALASSEDWPELLCQALLMRATVLRRHGELRESLAVNAQALSVLRGDDPALESQVLASEGFTHLRLGEHDQALACFQVASRRARSAGDMRLTQRCRVNLLFINIQQGQWEEARLNVARTQKLLASTGTRAVEGHCWNALGEIARFHEQWEEARGHYRRAGDIWSSIGHMNGYVARCNLALVEIGDARFSQAHAMLREVRAAYAAHGYEVGLPLVDLGLVACAAAEEDWRSFDPWLSRAQKLVEKTGRIDRELAWLAELAGDLTQSGGQPERAGALYDLAASQWRELGEAQKAAAVEEKRI